jgi:Family of unknown function (DUF6314)
MPPRGGPRGHGRTSGTLSRPATVSGESAGSVQDVSCDAPGPLVVGSTLGYLQGRWTLTRGITDNRLRQVGRFDGEASFLPGSGEANGVRLEYRERGELSFGGHRGPACRSLILLAAPDESADVLFADGREFYRLDLRSGCWQAEHPCREDRYLVTVSVLGADRFIESWQVRGPNTDYDMTATLVRTGRQA